MQNTPASSSSIVRLNVGGKRFFTTRETLGSKGPCLLTALTDSDSKMNRIFDEKGCIFLDRSPELFAQVLQYLRGGSAVGVGVQSELDYYGLTKHEGMSVSDSALISLCKERRDAKHTQFVEMHLEAVHATVATIMQDLHANANGTFLVCSRYLVAANEYERMATLTSSNWNDVSKKIASIAVPKSDNESDFWDAVERYALDRYSLTIKLALVREKLYYWKETLTFSFGDIADADVNYTWRFRRAEWALQETNK